MKDTEDYGGHMPRTKAPEDLTALRQMNAIMLVGCLTVLNIQDEDTVFQPMEIVIGDGELLTLVEFVYCKKESLMVKLFTFAAVQLNDQVLCRHILAGYCKHAGSIVSDSTDASNSMEGAVISYGDARTVQVLLTHFANSEGKKPCTFHLQDCARLALARGFKTATGALNALIRYCDEENIKDGENGHFVTAVLARATTAHKFLIVISATPTELLTEELFLAAERPFHEDGCFEVALQTGFIRPTESILERAVFYGRGNIVRILLKNAELAAKVRSDPDYWNDLCIKRNCHHISFK
jgi:hypothetical protein